MKLNIEELAREVGFEVHPSKKQIRVGIDCLTGVDSTAKLEAFASLIVERCATVCEEEAAGHRSGFGDHCAIMIRRQLLED